MKKILLSTLLLGSLLLTACGGNSSENDSSKVESGKTEITFLNGFTGGDGAFMKKITDGFNESQDEYSIKEIQDKDHYTKFKTGEYDLVVIHGNNLETYKQDGMIQDVSGLMKDANLNKNDFHPVTSDIVGFEDGVYAIPLDIHPLTTFYNKTLTSEAPKNYEDLSKLTKELQNKDTNLYAMGVPDSGLVEFYTMTIAAQNKVNLLEGNHLNFAQEGMVDALMTFHDMVWKDKISPSGLGLDGEFQSFMKEAQEGNSGVQTAVSLTGPWYYAAVKEKYGDDLGIASIPQLGQDKAVYGNSHTLALPSNVKDEETLKGLAAFLEYMYKPEVLANWADGGQAPLHTATMDYIAENSEKYPLAYQNQQQFDSFAAAPQVYQFGEQMRYMNETVFGRLVKEEKLTKKQLMDELEKATDKAKQIAETAPNK